MKIIWGIAWAGWTGAAFVALWQGKEWMDAFLVSLLCYSIWDHQK